MKKKDYQWKKTYKSVATVMGAEARSALYIGVSKLANVGQQTLGPGGRNIALEYDAGPPKLTKDGVTVIKTIHLADRAEEMGAKLLKKIAGSANTYAGDGTTTAALLSREIL